MRERAGGGNTRSVFRAWDAFASLPLAYLAVTEKKRDRLHGGEDTTSLVLAPKSIRTAPNPARMAGGHELFSRVPPTMGIKFPSVAASGLGFWKARVLFEIPEMKLIVPVGIWRCSVCSAAAAAVVTHGDLNGGGGP